MISRLDALKVAGGAPARVRGAAAGLDLLGQLESGTLAFDGRAWSLSGTAAGPLQAMTCSMRPFEVRLADEGWTYEVKLPASEKPAAAPVVADYTFKAEKLPAGTVSLSGYLPTAGLQRYLAGRTGARVVDTTKLGAGAPGDFVATVVPASTHWSSSMRANWSSDGTWRLRRGPTSPTFPAAQATLAAAADTSDWSFAFAAPPPLAPLAEPFTWSATKAPDGSYTLAGNVGNHELRRYLAVAPGRWQEIPARYARGEPAGFVSDLMAGLAALDHLEFGTVAFDGATWSVSGTPQTTGDGETAVASLAAAQTPVARWKTSIDAPLTVPGPAVAAAPEPKVADASQCRLKPHPLRSLGRRASRTRNPISAEPALEAALPAAAPAASDPAPAGEIRGHRAGRYSRSHPRSVRGLDARCDTHLRRKAQWRWAARTGGLGAGRGGSKLFRCHCRGCAGRPDGGRRPASHRTSSTMPALESAH